ncbi:hypothetical protein HGRIS_009787 [Hohenbuehelia grisea]|uniref:Dynamin N-terminal domain-containing protein n=1 Tax=Hohenbuehelia grisea TaxID=104357 RepID=A0ABR3J2A6_9AGAR
MDIHPDVVDRVGKGLAAVFEKGSKLVEQLSGVVDELSHGNESQLRKNVWSRELKSLRDQKPPTTLIAICGPSGAGKSSLINAILDGDLVPTSDSEACTAAITEVGYHNKPNAEADITFLSRDEWFEEFAVIRQEMLNDDGTMKHISRLDEDADIAWRKSRRILAVSARLGQTELFHADDIEALAKQISPFIRTPVGEQAKKNKSSSKASKSSASELNIPAFWPLIRQAKVRRNAPALATGAVLVDLPGVADTNAARSSIAQTYTKKCDRIWVVSRISRAKDDKSAKGESDQLHDNDHILNLLLDILGQALSLGQILSYARSIVVDGNYDNGSITFVASRCEEITCSDAIRSFHLEGEPELEQLEQQLSEFRGQIQDCKDEKRGSERGMKGKMTIIQFAVLLTHTTAAWRPRRSTAKRRLSSDEESEDDEDISSGSEAEVSDRNDESESEDSVQGVKAQVARLKPFIKALKEERDLAKAKKRAASDRLELITHKSDGVQRQKNAYCSIKRSEASRSLIQTDFRRGLKEYDDSTAEKNDPYNFDPSSSLRDYESIKLPVFTCSTQDYMRLTNPAKGDGRPHCFQNVEDTGIPALQQWCHEITLSLHEHAAQALTTQLKAFATTIQAYTQEISEADAQGCDALRKMWQTKSPLVVKEDPDPNSQPDPDTALIFKKYNIKLEFNHENDHLCLQSSAVEPSEIEENNSGISCRLIKEFDRIVDENMELLKERFRDGLEEKCRAGAAKAIAAAVTISDNYAQQRWQTYRASLSRLGVFRRNLNAELIQPFITTIAHSWGQVFESDLFGAYENSVMIQIDQLILDMSASAADGLKTRIAKQGKSCKDEAQVTAKKMLEGTKQAMQNQQKEISRCFAPHIQAQLKQGYVAAMAERGVGSVRRQADVFHRFIDESRRTAFSGGAEVMLERLSESAEAVGVTLKASLREVAEKV